MPHGVYERPSFVGRVFSRLKVESLRGYDKYGRRVWSCKCKCGEISFAVSGQLTSGQKRSCGCLAREFARKAIKKAHAAPKWVKHLESRKKFVGRRFKYLTIISLFSRNGVWAKCKCKCGKMHEALLPLILNGNTKSCGCYMREVKRRFIVDWRARNKKKFVARMRFLFKTDKAFEISCRENLHCNESIKKRSEKLKKNWYSQNRDKVVCKCKYCGMKFHGYCRSNACGKCLDLQYAKRLMGRGCNYPIWLLSQKAASIKLFRQLRQFKKVNKA